MLELLGGGELGGEDKGIEAGFVDDVQILLSAKGVAFRYPLVVFVNMIRQCFAGVAVSQHLGHILTNKPGGTLFIDVNCYICPSSHRRDKLSRERSGTVFSQSIFPLSSKAHMTGEGGNAPVIMSIRSFLTVCFLSAPLVM